MSNTGIYVHRVKPWSASRESNAGTSTLEFEIEDTNKRQGLAVLEELLGFEVYRDLSSTLQEIAVFQDNGIKFTRINTTVPRRQADATNTTILSAIKVPFPGVAMRLAKNSLYDVDRGTLTVRRRLPTLQYTSNDGGGYGSTMRNAQVPSGAAWKSRDSDESAREGRPGFDGEFHGSRTRRWGGGQHRDRSPQRLSNVGRYPERYRYTGADSHRDYQRPYVHESEANGSRSSSRSTPYSSTYAPPPTSRAREAAVVPVNATVVAVPDVPVIGSVTSSYVSPTYSSEHYHTGASVALPSSGNPGILPTLGHGLAGGDADNLTTPVAPVSGERIKGLSNLSESPSTSIIEGTVNASVGQQRPDVSVDEVKSDEDALAVMITPVVTGAAGVEYHMGQSGVLQVWTDSSQPPERPQPTQEHNDRTVTAIRVDGVPLQFVAAVLDALIEAREIEAPLSGPVYVTQVWRNLQAAGFIEVEDRPEDEDSSISTEEGGSLAPEIVVQSEDDHQTAAERPANIPERPGSTCTIQ